MLRPTLRGRCGRCFSCLHEEEEGAELGAWDTERGKDRARLCDLIRLALGPAEHGAGFGIADDLLARRVPGQLAA